MSAPRSGDPAVAGPDRDGAAPGSRGDDSPRTVAHGEADPRVQRIHEALARVIDPEIHKPITELGMVGDVAVDDAGIARITVLLTIEGCPLRGRIEKDTAEAAATVPGLTEVRVETTAMSEEQRRDLTRRLREGRRAIPFNDPGSLTRVLAVSSGKGGVGKSSVTANLAAAMALDGLRVGILDADIHGFSMTGMLGITDRPTKVGDLLMPPEAHGVKVMSIGMFVPPGQAVVWRGPKMHRAIEQFASDVYWGDLDVLLLDLPPGTGDVAISVAQLLPRAEMLVVTTPQPSAAGVAERVGSLAQSVEQDVAGVIENMSAMEMPDGSRLEVFGSGGGDRVAASLAGHVGHPVPVLGRIPLDTRLREGADEGTPVVVADPESPSARELRRIARGLGRAPRGLAGRRLPLTVR